MKETFRDKLGLSPPNRERLKVINSIIEEYRGQGYVLTLRQLYYQLVSRDIIQNNIREYKKLGDLLVKGRMAGVVDWDAIEDRVRVPDKPASWDSPAQILDACAKQYRRDRLAGQRTHIEVWVEKDALSGVLKRVTHQFGATLMVNRGYSSCSAMHDAWLRIENAADKRQKTVIFYLGDHDPSGLDMDRDIHERLAEFSGDRWCESCDPEEPADDCDNIHLTVRRIALTSEQVRKHNPPPNPAKFTDSRAPKYVEQFGKTSWEVDALKPELLNKLVEDAIWEYIDGDVWDKQNEREDREREKLRKLVGQLSKDDREEDKT